MRTSLLILLGFAVFAVTVASKPKKDATKNTRDADKATPKDTENGDFDDAVNKEERSEAPESIGKGKRKKTNPKDSKSKKNEETGEMSSAKSKKDPKKKSPKKTTKKGEDNDLRVDDSLEDILGDEEEDEVEIPSLNQLTTDTDPIELGQKIKKIKDEKTREQLRRKLKKMWKANKKSLPGKFYQAAYASLIDEDEASKFWEDKLEEATKMVEEADQSISGNARKALGNSFENIKNIVAADPLGMGLEKGESIFLTALSDTLKNIGKVTDSAYDAAMNTSGIVDALTAPVDLLPIAGTMKRNFHNKLESDLRRGKYLFGSFAENGSKAYENAAKDADQKAEAKQDMLKRSFSSKRTL